MPTTVVKTIKSGGDYTTWQSWEDATPANLVTADQIWQGQGAGSFVSATALLVVSGTTVDATRYVEATTEAGASFRDNANAQTNRCGFDSANGCALSVTAGYVIPISVNQEFTRISNLQVQQTGATGSSQTIHNSLAGGTSSLIVDNCILENARGDTIDMFGSGMKLRNSLCVQRGASRPSIATIKNGGLAVNCTFAVPSNISAATVAVVGAYVATTYKNCNFFGCTNISSGTAPTFTTCYTSVASPPSGCTTAAYNTSQFAVTVNTTHDFKLVAGSAMIDVGTTDATNAANDIVKTARPQGSAYDVGCWEYKVAATTKIRRTLGPRMGSRQGGFVA